MVKKQQIERPNHKIFAPPTAAQIASAIGFINDLPYCLQSQLSDFNQFDPVPSPGPNDWLSLHQEPGQSIEQYIQFQPNSPRGVRNKVYLQPLGRFKQESSPDLKLLKAFTQAYLGLEVIVLDPIEIEENAIIEKQVCQETRQMQILADDILFLLQSDLQPDAYCKLGITMVDLATIIKNERQENVWDWVYGLAALKKGTGVFSFARYDPYFFNMERGENWKTQMLLRSCQTLIHETMHMFGLHHCIYFNCVMNGSNNQEESDRQPLHLCPVCLRKMYESLGFDVLKRYEQIEQFCRNVGFIIEAEWYLKQIQLMREM